MILPVGVLVRAVMMVFSALFLIGFADTKGRGSFLSRLIEQFGKQ